MLEIIPQAQAAITNPEIGALGDAAVASNPQAAFSNLLIRFGEVAFALGALLVLFFLIWAGIDWITSGGDKGKTEKARNKIIQSIIGLIVLASTYAIFFLIINFLGVKGDVTLFTQQIYRSYAPVTTYNARNVVRN